MRLGKVLSLGALATVTILLVLSLIYVMPIISKTLVH